jgi:hypothetical protein
MEWTTLHTIHITWEREMMVYHLRNRGFTVDRRKNKAVLSLLASSGCI